jgi:hypothetical protein
LTATTLLPYSPPIASAGIKVRCRRGERGRIVGSDLDLLRTGLYEPPLSLGLRSWPETMLVRYEAASARGIWLSYGAAVAGRA